MVEQAGPQIKGYLMPTGIERRLDMETLVEEHYPAPTAATGVFKDTDEYDWEMLTSDIAIAILAAQDPGCSLPFNLPPLWHPSYDVLPPPLGGGALRRSGIAFT